MIGTKIRAWLRNNKALGACFVLTLMLPSVILTFTENFTLWESVTAMFLPAGLYMLWFAAAKRSGRMVLWGIWLLVLAAFEIVIIYLFGGSIIAVDMFTNLFTTSPGEAGELLGNLWPIIVFVCVLYVPVIAWGIYSLRQRCTLAARPRRNMALAGGLLLAASLVAGSYNVYPANVMHNVYLSIKELGRVSRFHQTSARFSYQARRYEHVPEREIYVLVIGEASRAANWSLYGYARQTNPRLTRGDVVPFRNVLTQSNATHKSVPLILSSVSADNHDRIYERKGIASLFREAGFRTAFVSNQAPNHGLIDLLAAEADERVYINGSYDGELARALRETIERDTADLLVILHAYGSHYCYNDRYPEGFSRFTPDDNVAISRRHREEMVNSYDNSILYTDHVLAEIIGVLQRQQGYSAMLYCSDHGEDLFDDSRGRFLHASPTTTYYQLHVACLGWFSEGYAERFSDHVAAARSNTDAPATTHSVFHTMARMASIESPYIDQRVSLVDRCFDYARQRNYLDDHSRPVPFSRTGLIDEDYKQFNRYEIGVN